MTPVSKAFLAIVFAGCTAPIEQSESSAHVISDEAHGGRRGFWLLPPLVAAPTPSGVFDAELHPSVEIRAIETGELVADLGDLIEIDATAEQYRVNWHTEDLDPEATYRIHIGLDGQTLGFADVKAVSDARALRAVDDSQYIPLVDGRTLPIKFRIEAGVRCAGDARSCIVRVPDDTASLQEAIDRVGDGGLVMLAPGTFSEPVRIAGKWVHLRGDHRERPQIVLPTPRAVPDLRSAVGLVDVSGPGGRIENLVLRGGDVGIRGEGMELAVSNVTVEGNGYGIVGTWRQFVASHLTIIGSLANAFQGCGGDQKFLDATIANAGGMGLFAPNCSGAQASITIDQSNFSGNAKGGAAIVGNYSVGITSSVFDGNAAFGILLFDVPNALLIENTVSNTLEGSLVGTTATYDGLADGLLVVSSPDVAILASHFIDNARSGLFLYESAASMSFSSSTGGKYGAVLQQSTLALFGDNVLSGTEQDTLSDGALPVPEAPPVPE